MKEEDSRNKKITEHTEKAVTSTSVNNCNNWEKKFHDAYQNAMQSNIKDFWSASIAIMNLEKEIIKAIKKDLDNQEEARAIETVYNGINDIAKKYTDDVRSQFTKLDTDRRNEYITEYVGILSVASEMLYTFGDELEYNFGDKYYSFAAESWKKAIKINSTYVKYVSNKKQHMVTIEKYAAKIIKFDAKYEIPEIKVSSSNKSTLKTKLNKLFDIFK